MKLFEYEGKKLFERQGIPIPKGKVIKKPDELDSLLISFESTAVKAQVASGKRAHQGGIMLCNGLPATKRAVKKMLQSSIDGQKVERALVEQYIAIEKEHYLAFTYDTRFQGPVALASYRGGSGIEEQKENIIRFPVDIETGFRNWMSRSMLEEAGFSQEEILHIAPIFLKLWNVFCTYDCRLAEINPLTRVLGNIYLANDAKIILDDEALFRHEDFAFPPRAQRQTISWRETAAKKIDQNDKRGTAGSVYFDLDGDIAVLSAGGGASMVCMDALISYGGKPANFTEYSGNPPREKLALLTKIVLSKPSLAGLWIVGGTANFTDIYETMVGIVEGLRSIRPKTRFPIVIRRGGPRTDEAFEMLRETGKKEGYDFHLFKNDVSMTLTAKTMVDLAKKYMGINKIKSRIPRGKPWGILPEKIK